MVRNSNLFWKVDMLEEQIMLFDKTRKALSDYEELLKNKLITNEEEYKVECAALDISKAFVYDLGYKDASKFARGILALGQLNPMR